MRKIQMLLFILTLISLSSCFVDIPNVRPDGPVTIVYGKVINNETKAPVSNAVISDGFSTTLTNSQGNYRFETAPGATHVFISVPERFEIPMKDGIPHIFERLNFDKDSVQVNFNLKPLAGGVENDFTLIAIGDPQVQNANHLRRLNNETIPDIINTIEEYNNVYGITLGDLAFDSLKLFSDLKQSFISTNIPIFHT